jgi:hypothetical protein
MARGGAFGARSSGESAGPPLLLRSTSSKGMGTAEAGRAPSKAVRGGQFSGLLRELSDNSLRVVDKLMDRVADLEKKVRGPFGREKSSWGWGGPPPHPQTPTPRDNTQQPPWWHPTNPKHTAVFHHTIKTIVAKASGEMELEWEKAGATMEQLLVYVGIPLGTVRLGPGQAAPRAATDSAPAAATGGGSGSGGPGGDGDGDGGGGACDSSTAQRDPMQAFEQVEITEL